MTLKQFNLLTEEEQDELVMDNGKFILNYFEENDMYDVYELYEFYVAFTYKLDRNDKAQIITASSADQLPHVFHLQDILT